MNQILCCDWLPERARYLHLTAPQEKFPKSYNKSFIDQACSVKMAGYWPHFFLRVYGPRQNRSINTQKKELGQYPAILTSHLVNNPYICLDTPVFILSLVSSVHSVCFTLTSLLFILFYLSVSTGTVIGPFGRLHSPGRPVKI